MWYGKRKFVVHLGGSWKNTMPGLFGLEEYSGGLRRVYSVEEDELNWMEFIQEIRMFVPRKKVSSVQCILAGYLCPLSTDKQLMDMWENIMVESDNKFHLFVFYDYQNVQGMTQDWETNPKVMGVCPSMPTHEPNSMPAHT
ncbi:hypothetical protein IFM89_007630 [Coptis chinensis]|uniref:Uncharacterized protein n=1 Tax=Coptis chinensis TaxID=261450 RepID=A0A835LV69_9MAGN|nr:hypothetical protein IFM89_007630 [Coptis chinensis]